MDKFDTNRLGTFISRVKADLKGQNVDYLSLVIGTIKTPQESTVKPHVVRVPHCIYPEQPSLCIFARDPHGSLKKAFEEIKVKNISKIIPVSSLKTKYAPFEAKRALSTAFNMFIMDNRVVGIIPKLLGKSFYAKNKHPIPMDLTELYSSNPSPSALKKTKTDIFELINHSTYFFFNNGPCISLKIGNTNQITEQICENVLSAISFFKDNDLLSFDNIRSIHIKASKSLAFPIYTTEVET